MSASLVAALALAVAQQVVIPIGNPPRVERAVAPLATAGPLFAGTCEENDDWDKPAPPVRLHGNTFLVGTCGISAILVTGSDGHVLIDAGTENGADLIAANIRRLGFGLTDIKYLLHSHEHLDHVGGMARLQQLTGAQLVASADAAAVFRTGAPGAGDPQAGMHPPFPAARVDRIIKHGETVRLRDLQLTAVETKGHTPGALSWQWVSCDGGVCRTIAYADSLSPISRDDYRFTDHPAALEAFRTSISRVAALECDILLTPHPSASDMVDRLAGRAPLRDPDACRLFAASKADELDHRLAKDLAGK
jgi:metallo-beta-lactamase class B